MSNLTLPTVLAFDRKLEPSDALMYSGNWDKITDSSQWQAIELFERRNRAVKSNFKQEILDDEEELQKQIAEANLAWGDDAALAHDNDTLKVSFSLRIVSGLERPSVCNKIEFEKSYSEKISNYTNSNLEELAKRYAYNIANGRFLWRNRVGAQEIKVFVSHSSLSSPLEFNAYDFSLTDTTMDHDSVNAVAQLIKAGLVGNENTLLTINAYVKLGDGQRVWPSQEMVLNSPKGEKSRHLFHLNGKAAMHCEKIGNALRTIDDWYPDAKAPIAIEAYGSVTQRGIAYRSSKNDFKTLLLKWLNDGSVSNEDKHFVVAMVIRGGVFGEGES
ncbi:type I-F CRISPR-associated protein Csy3 [Candidatus Berkiella cookevillensis]|uniref:CRISPR-associated protein Csy3 n=1 Tax=Candidatus Berkiella cookevillensis TaxID=437022 RepID=A0A0Q9YND3_9GAMM|nr:type I-F CRISPR-associated protein Csy3 [Candidatus Berkiella cookevillensis]MCS5709103.1 type I-F CRISPR-associated protein Csy3 [Candidatus Berkiella cookevillensis]